MANKKLKELELTFENLESVTIPGNYVGMFSLSKIHKDFVKAWHWDNVHELDVSGSALLILKPEANIKIEKCVSKDKKIFDRIKEYNDLSIVTTMYDDGTSRDIAMHWYEGDDFVNRYQSSLETSNGYLIVVVDPDNNADKYRESVEKIPKDTTAE